LILISVEKVLNDEHYAQVPVVRMLGEQIDHSLADVVHLVVYDDQRLHGDRHDARYPDILRLRSSIFPGEQQIAHADL
jgi:hypothetical protein